MKIKYIVKIMFLSTVFILNTLNCMSQKNNCSCSAILIPKHIEIPLYSSMKGNIVENKLINDTITEEYYVLSIIETKKYRSKVKAITPFDTIPKTGWIQTEYLGIYPSSFSQINLYRRPRLKANVKSIIIKPEYYPLNILKCKGDWLYVTYVDIDKKIKEGWLSPEDQCANPYSTCN